MKDMEVENYETIIKIYSICVSMPDELTDKVSCIMDALWKSV